VKRDWASIAARFATCPVRIAIVPDIPLLAELLHWYSREVSFAEEIGFEQAVDVAGRMLKDPFMAVMLLCDESGMASATLTSPELWGNVVNVNIGHLFVRPECRGMRRAVSLLNSIYEMGKAIGAERIVGVSQRGDGLYSIVGDPVSVYELRL